MNNGSSFGFRALLLLTLLAAGGGAQAADADGDGCDPDTDGDCVANASDAFPLDPTETTDMDGESRDDVIVGAPGDVNADGYADLIAGTRLDDSLSDLPATKDTGSVSVWSATDNSDMKILYGTAAKDYFGSAVSAGDINRDGKADLIIGIPGLDITAVKPIKDAGTVKIVSGASL